MFPGGRVGLLDYGQSKQLPDESRLAFAELIRNLDIGDHEDIAASLKHVGVRLEEGDVALQARMAYGMFDTRGRQAPAWHAAG